MCDRLEFKLYSPYNKGEEWVQYYIDCYRKGEEDQDHFYCGKAFGYDVNLAILINGVDIADIVLDKAEWKVAAFNTAYRDEPRRWSNHLEDWQLDFKPTIKDWAYPDRRSSTRSRLRSGLLG